MEDYLNFRRVPIWDTFLIAVSKLVSQIHISSSPGSNQSWARRKRLDGCYESLWTNFFLLFYCWFMTRNNRPSRRRLETDIRFLETRHVVTNHWWTSLKEAWHSWSISCKRWQERERNLGTVNRLQAWTMISSPCRATVCDSVRHGEEWTIGNWNQPLFLFSMVPISRSGSRF